MKQLVKKAHDTFNAGRPLTTLRFLHHPKARPAKNGAEPLSGVAGSSESHPRARDPSSVTGSIGSVSSSPTTSSSTSPSSSSSVCSSSSSASILLNPDIDGMLGQESGSRAPRRFSWLGFFRICLHRGEFRKRCYPFFLFLQLGSAGRLDVRAGSTIPFKEN